MIPAVSARLSEAIGAALLSHEGADRLRALMDGGATADAAPFVVRPLALQGVGVEVRPTAEDARAFVDAFVQKLSMPTAILPEGGTMVTIGAHVGYSAALWLAADPSVHVVCVEMEDACVEACRRNLAAFGARASVVRAAAWGVVGRVFVTGGDHVTRRIAALNWYPGEEAPKSAPVGQVDAESVPVLMDRLGIKRAKLLHLDINGAEASVLDQTSPWLKRFDAAMVHVRPPAKIEQIRWRLSEQGMVVKADPRDERTLMAVSKALAYRQPRFATPMEHLAEPVSPG